MRVRTNSMYQQLRQMGDQNLSTTANFVISLPQGAAEYVQQRIADGTFESPSDYVESLVVSDMLGQPPSEAELEQWMNTEGARRVEAQRADPSPGLSAAQAFAGLLSAASEKEGNG